jgi:hypothetical protein
LTATTTSANEPSWPNAKAAQVQASAARFALFNIKRAITGPIPAGCDGVHVACTHQPGHKGEVDANLNSLFLGEFENSTRISIDFDDASGVRSRIFARTPNGRTIALLATGCFS